MDDLVKDKLKLEEILNEIANLKKYKNELASNTRGEALEQYIDNLSKNINLLEQSVEKTYDDYSEKIEIEN